MLQCLGCQEMHDHWAAQKPIFSLLHRRIHMVGRDSYPFSSGRRSRPRLHGLQQVACWPVHSLFQCSLLARQQLADTAQRQIVTEDAKTCHRTTTYTGNLGDPAPPGRIGDVDFNRWEFYLAQSRDEGRMPR
jgi:hypothetical protein